MSSAEIAKVMISVGLLIILISFIFAIVNMMSLIERRKPSRHGRNIRLAGFDHEEEFRSPFRRHGLAMICIVIGMAFIGAAIYVGGIDLGKEILRQFGVNV